MISEKNLLKVLDKSDLEAIHGATMDVLGEVGVVVDSEQALDLLQRNGYEVDRRTKIVRMSEDKVTEAVKSCKRNFRWHARSEKHSLDVVDGKTKFGPGAQCLLYLDPVNNEPRSATLQDGINVCRLMDALDGSSLGYVPIYPSDVPEHAMSAVMWAAGLINSSKACYGGWGDDDEFELMLKVVDILLGDRERLRKVALFPAYIDPVSPLAHDQAMLQTLIRYSEWDLPVFVMVMALAGGTAPASLAGLLVQQNAEILSSIAVSRCVNKAPKIIYGSVSCPLDMRSGTSVTGSPEFSLLGVGAVQMAKYYGLPSDMGVQSDSKTIDAQTSYEKMQSALMSVLSGADFAELFLGSTEAFNAFSPVQLILDDEIASYVHRIAQGIEVTEDTLSVDVIAKIGPQGNFLKHPKTSRHFRAQHSVAKQSDRSTRQQWTSLGRKNSEQRARERMTELLKSHEPEPLEPEMLSGMDALVKEYTKDFSIESLAKARF